VTTSEGAFADGLVVRATSDSGRHVVGGRFGPAGVVKVALDRGLVVAVDAVELGQLAFVDLDANIVRKEVVSELVGESRVEPLMRDAVSLDMPVRVPPIEPSSRRRTSRPTSWPTPGETPQIVGEMIHRVALCNSPDTPRLVATIAGLEILLRAEGLDELPALRSLFVEHARESLSSIILEPDDLVGDFAALDTRTREAVIALLNQATSSFDGVENLIPTLQSIRIESTDGIASDVPTGVRVSDPSGRLQIQQGDEGFVTLLLDRSFANHWVRVTNSASQELVALAPVMKIQKNVYVADILLPSDDPSAEFVFEVTREPLPLRSRIDLHIQALNVGYSASVADRAGDRQQARDLWNYSAELWLRVNDKRRAELALRYARQRVSFRRHRSLVDRVLVALELPV